MRLADFMHLAGEDWDIRRGGKLVATVQGMRVVDKGKVDFLPGTDVQADDEITGKLCQQTYKVARTDNFVAHGAVFSVEAYYEKPGRRGGGHNVTIGSAVGSAIMVGSAGASQTVGLTPDTSADLKQIIRGLLRSLDKLGLSDDDKAEVKEDAEYLKKKLDSDKSEPGLVKECLRGIKTKLADAAAVAAASGVVAKVTEYASLVGDFWHKHFGG
jgi:hypothetical protein